jgi:glutaredoxin
MTITFYNMKGCGYCTKAEEMLKNQISSGEIIKRPSTEAPNGTTGFPYFFNNSNNKEYTGLPKDYLTLMDAITEKYYHPNALIIFYSMNGCGHCTEAKKMLSEHIKIGYIIVKEHNEAPESVRAFPAFQSIKSSKIVIGKPNTFEDLIIKLEISLESNVENNIENNMECYKHTSTFNSIIGVH